MNRQDPGGHSTHSTADFSRLRDWLLVQIDENGWSQAQFARELGMAKITVNRWLQPPESPHRRRPSYESCRKIAQLFGVELSFILDLAGIDEQEDEQNATQMQRNAIAMIGLIPDDILSVVYPQLRTLIDQQVQESIRKSVRTALSRMPTPIRPDQEDQP